MTYVAKNGDGVAVFIGDKKPEEGTLLRVEPAVAALAEETIGQKLLKLAGKLDGPEDGAITCMAFRKNEHHFFR